MAQLVNSWNTQLQIESDYHLASHDFRNLDTWMYTNSTELTLTYLYTRLGQLKISKIYWWLACGTWFEPRRTVHGGTIWNGFGGSFWYGESEKTIHERWKAMEPVKKSDQSLGSKTLITFFSGSFTFNRPWIVFSDSPYQKLLKPFPIFRFRSYVRFP